MIVLQMLFRWLCPHDPNHVLISSSFLKSHLFSSVEIICSSSLGPLNSTLFIVFFFNYLHDFRYLVFGSVLTSTRATGESSKIQVPKPHFYKILIQQIWERTPSICIPIEYPQMIDACSRWAKIHQSLFFKFLFFMKLLF